MSCHW
jgi:hypothetical protein